MYVSLYTHAHTHMQNVERLLWKDGQDCTLGQSHLPLRILSVPESVIHFKKLILKF